MKKPRERKDGHFKEQSIKGKVVRTGRRFCRTVTNGRGETKKETGMFKVRVTYSEACADDFFMACGKFGSKETKVAGISLSIVRESRDS